MIIAGDPNSKHHAWNSRKNNSASRSLYKYVNSRHDITITAPDTLTRYPSDIRYYPVTLDIAIIKTGQMDYHLKNFPSDLSSDHSPMVIDTPKKSSRTSPPKPFYAIDWEKFEENIKNIAITLPKNISTPLIDKVKKHIP